MGSAVPTVPVEHVPDENTHEYCPHILVFDEGSNIVPCSPYVEGVPSGFSFVVRCDPDADCSILDPYREGFYVTGNPDVLCSTPFRGDFQMVLIQFAPGGIARKRGW